MRKFGATFLHDCNAHKDISHEKTNKGPYLNVILIHQQMFSFPMLNSLCFKKPAEGQSGTSL